MFAGVSLFAETFENSSYSADKTVIKYALFGGSAEVAIAGQICRAFVQKNPQFILDVSIYPWAQYWTKVQVQAASGLAPDVITLYSGNIGVWVQNGAIRCIDEFMAEIDPNDYYPAAMDICRWSGKQYGMPLEVSARTLVYSADRFRECGIQQEDWPRADKPIRWQQFKDLARRLTLTRPDGTILQYGMAGGMLWNQTMYRMYGGDMLDRAVDPTRSTAAGNELLARGVAEVFKMQYADRTMLGLLKLSAGGVENMESLLISPRFAMATTGPWALVQMKEAGVDFRLAPMPENICPTQLVNVNAVGIYTHSQHPHEAWTFVKYLASNEAQSILGRKLKNIPALTSASDAFIHNELGIEGCEAFLCQMPVAVPEVTSANAFLIAEVSKWGEWLEQLYADEYDRRYKALPRQNATIPRAEYNAFVSGMEEFIEHTADTELLSLERGFNQAFARAQMPRAGLWTRIIWPVCVAALLAVLLILYVRSLKKSTGTIATAAYRSQTAAGYLCVSPWIVGFVCFSLLPVIAAVAISMTDWNMIRPAQYVGLRNYLHLAHDDYFLIGLGKTFKYAAFVIPISLLGGLFTAGLLTCNIRGSAFFKSIIYFPSLFADAAAAVLWVNMFNKDYGIINHLLGYLGIAPINWGDMQHVFYAVILMNFFWIGSSMIIYYAGMKQIPRALYEAAEIDGAGPIRRFIYITIPMLSPVIMFTVVVTTIGAFQVFTPALFFSPDAAHLGMPGDSLRFYAVNIYNEAFGSLRMGNACCYAVILFAIIFSITLLQLKLARRFVHTEEPA
ncbi:MAG: extracellular solute-binding protein [Planctomycetaceae bacterium]|nr:extracellular solute-binding protein [Planctomycetaceae bacterium]